MRSGAFRALAALALFAVLALLARLWSLQVPLSEDAGAYLYVGDVIRDGGLPYVDAADNKGPLTYLLFGALDIVSGGSTTALRLTLVLACALTALAVAARVRRAAGDLAGLAAGAAMAILARPRFSGAGPQHRAVRGASARNGVVARGARRGPLGHPPGRSWRWRCS